jgi:hypothetical protein
MYVSLVCACAVSRHGLLAPVRADDAAAGIFLRYRRRIVKYDQILLAKNIGLLFGGAVAKRACNVIPLSVQALIEAPTSTMTSVVAGVACTTRTSRERCTGSL